jgi:anhydro-N-acetylmuramic acid kinase
MKRKHSTSTSSKAGLYVGLMSGTSADGIDVVVAELSGRQRGLQAQIRAHVAQPFSPALRKRILHACLHGAVAELCELNFELGEQFARATLAVLRKAKLKPNQITAIGSHGQTVHHLPNAKFPSTLQIGEPSVIAERTGITTIADFRVRDMAAGGQGAPLVPYADWVLFANRVRPRIIQNIGGIGNLTFLPPHAGLGDIIAFDTGPGNMVMDALVTQLSGGRQSFDRGGRWAARGAVSARLLEWCLSHPYLARKLPKTTGREEFGARFMTEFVKRGHKLKLKDADLIATATAFTAESIAGAYRRFIFPQVKSRERHQLQIILGGGGAKNPALVRMLTAALANECPNPAASIFTHEDFGMDSSAKEPLAFALLARATLHGEPGNVPGVTGARRAVVLGEIIPGRKGI